MCLQRIYGSYLTLFVFWKTKYNSIDENELSDYKTVPRKSKTHKYGCIHGICILVKVRLCFQLSELTEFMSESVLWLHIKLKKYLYNQVK